MLKDNFSIPIYREKAEDALQVLIRQIPYEITAQEVLEGLLQIANEKMAEAIKKISVAKGYDPSSYSLLSFGGSGSVHACKVAEILGAQKVIMPYDGGILSAYGIGHSKKETIHSKQLLQPLSEVELNLDTIFDELENQESTIVHSNRFVYLRLLGQDENIRISYNSNGLLRYNFKKRYIEIYGHWISNRSIEVESVRVVITHENHDEISLRPTIEGGKISSVEIPILNIHKTMNVEITGPAIILNDTSSGYVDKGWSGTTDENGNLVLTQTSIKDDSHISSESIALELFSNRFASIADQMGSLLQRTSFSVNIKERLDFSCALLDAGGELIVNAPHIPVHLGALGVCVRQCVPLFDLEEGDVIITNHPAYGGSHLPDITLIAPVFESGELVGYVANRSHHSEIGGITPGSMPCTAINLEEEGVIFEPQLLVNRGTLQIEQIERVLKSAKYPTRALPENIADLEAGLASLNAGKQTLLELCRDFGTEQVHYYMNALKSYADKLLDNKVNEWAFDTLSAKEEMDDGAQICVNISREGEKLHFDFNATSDQRRSNLNATEAIVTSAVIYVLRLLLDDDKLPLNEGLLHNVSITIPKGSFLNPVFTDKWEECPAVVGGNVEVSQRVVDTLLKAFGVAACSQGTMNNLLFGNDTFGYYETICGGVGATSISKGVDAVHQHMTNTKITDAEILEHRYPVRLNEFSIRNNSGGNGVHDGGNGINREIEFLDDVELTVLTQHRNTQPYGLNGAGTGKAGRQYVQLASGKIIDLKNVDSYKMQEGDKVIMKTPGGGAFGSS